MKKSLWGWTGVALALMVAAPLTVRATGTCDDFDSWVDRDSLWPPNHKLVDVGFGTSLDADIEVYSNEPNEDQTGDGHHSPDAKLDGCSLRLRSERKGNNTGRIYLIVARGSGNCEGSVTAQTVFVPHSKSKKAVAAVRAEAEDALEAFLEDGSLDGFNLILGEGADAPVIGPKQ